MSGEGASNPDMHGSEVHVFYVSSEFLCFLHVLHVLSLSYLVFCQLAHHWTCATVVVPYRKGNTQTLRELFDIDVN